MSLSVHEGFSGKSIFLTGGTGFMGKVLLFKLLKEFPDMESIYLLMRGKRSRKLNRFLSAQERLEKEVLGSPCFDPLRKSMGEEKFQMLSARVIGIEGNITDDRLGLSDKDCERVMHSVHFIVHMAATVQFDERLNTAVETNTLGGLRVLALAKECRKLEAMVHVSTCYVNYGIKGNVEECLYSLPFDPESMVKRILALHENEVDAVSNEILKKYGFPNTYTLTKSMGEQLIRSSKGNCPVVIVRPSIVGCSYKEPVPGWVDALTAAGGLLLTSGLGIVREIIGCKSAVADIVPVDFVVNVIIKALFKTQQNTLAQRAEKESANIQRVSKQIQHHQVGESLLNAAVQQGTLDKNAVNMKGGITPLISMGATHRQDKIEQQLQGQQRDSSSSIVFIRNKTSEASIPFVYHAATSSSLNNLTWERLRIATEDYWDWSKRHPKAIGPARVSFIPSNLLFSWRFYVYRVLPYQCLRLLVNCPPPIGSEERQKFVKNIGKAVSRSKSLNSQFRHFTMNEWTFSITNTLNLDNSLDDRSRSAFYFDTYMINWWFYAQVYSHGMLKFILKDTGRYNSPQLPEASTDIFKRASML